MKFNKRSLLYICTVSASAAAFTSQIKTSKIPFTSNKILLPTSSSTKAINTFSSIALKSDGRKNLSARKMMDDGNEDDIEEPLADGIDSVQWLPAISATKDENIESAREGAEILPLFPLGGIVYTPNSEHVLNIFEPRYRKMYTDILMNGTKRFVVSMSHPNEQGRFAEIGVLFELEDLKEVSGMTNDQIKYICNHRVTGRVKLHKILNPSVWNSRETYLKVEGTLLDKDVGGTNSKQEIMDEYVDNDVYASVAAAALRYEESAPKEEKMLKGSFKELVDLQHELEEDVRFTRASVNTLAVSPGDKDEGLWTTIRLWQSYIEQRLVGRQNELQQDFQKKLIQFLLKEKGVKEEELPSAVGFTDLSPSLQQEVQDLQKRIAVELEPLILESTLTIQKILEADDHKERLGLVRYFVDAERKRLEARKVLQGMFTPGDDQSITEELLVEDSLDSIDDEIDDDSTSGSGSIFFDDDSFQ